LPRLTRAAFTTVRSDPKVSRSSIEHDSNVAIAYFGRRCRKFLVDGCTIAED
jgi:hypothetical protein